LKSKSYPYTNKKKKAELKLQNKQTKQSKGVVDEQGDCFHTKGVAMVTPNKRVI